MFLWLPLVIGPAGYTPEATLTGWWLQSQPRSSVFSWVAVSPHRTGVVQGLGRDVGRQNPGWFPPLPLLPFWDSHLSLPCLQLPWLGTLVLGFFFFYQHPVHATLPTAKLGVAEIGKFLCVNLLLRMWTAHQTLPSFCYLQAAVFSTSCPDLKLSVEASFP